MKHPFRRLALAGLIAIAGGCATPRALLLTERNAVSIEHAPNGVLLATSQKIHAAILAPYRNEFTGRTDGEPAFLVIAANGDTQPIDLSAARIRAFSGNRRVVVYDRAKWDERLIAEQAQAADFKAGTSPSRLSALEPSAFENATNQMAAARRVADDVRRSAMSALLAARKGGAKAGTAAWMLTSQWIAPGQTGGGLIQLRGSDIKTGQPLRLEVDLGGETHVFSLDVAR